MIHARGRGSLIDPPALHACWLAANERLTDSSEPEVWWRWRWKAWPVSDDGSSEPDVALWPASTSCVKTRLARWASPGELVVADANGVHPVPLPLKMLWLALGQDWLTQDANREYIEARLRAEAWWDDAYDANMDEAGAVTMTEVSAERHGVLGIGIKRRANFWISGLLAVCAHAWRSGPGRAIRRRRLRWRRRHGRCCCVIAAA